MSRRLTAARSLFLIRFRQPISRGDDPGIDGQPFAEFWNCMSIPKRINLHEKDDHPEDRFQIPTRHCEDYKPVMFDLSQTLFLSTPGR